ncbi:hypothetical protein SERLA73DRAFT_178296 [Serpula lacrymans var. lacrymans S7.3]|uniref:C2H2-type domain-containing protein n=1 Tax=Serpula lacrymans var. lacrymans (strain S7.3) TaxID=936435 RepID=F8PR92_SERL3|nr:hypothetical protein SERLA73DRAFT_178296 [Serpula lacrymans var. lacrymans S7.3]
MIIDDPQASVKSLVADVEAMNVGDVDAPSELKRGKKRKQMAYVLVPSAPSWKKQHASRQMLSDQALNDEDSYAPLEKYVMDQALSKISENPCRWQNCNAILNSGEKLGVHLLLHTKDIDKKSPFLCRWQDCGMKFSSLLKLRTHVEKHPKSSLPCSILGCLQHFTTPIDVMQHEVLHQAPGSDVAIPVKSTTQPYTPRLPSSLGPIPEILPSYRVEPRHVRQAIISAQRHAVLGPWVLRNIFGPVELGMKKPNAAVPLRYYSRPSGVPEDVPQPMQDDYDFLIPLSSGVPKSLVLDDLPSAPISQMIQAGLVFFDTAKITNKTGPVPDAAGGAVTHYTASSNASDAALHHDGQPGSLVVDRQEFSSISVGPVDEVAEADWPKHKNSGEEEAVEKMLL